MDNDLKILAFAPACHPESGSERGVGWVWSRLLAGLGDAWVLTRPRNREAIEAAAAELPEGHRPRFVYVEVPGWPQRPGRGRAAVHYFLWHAVALRAARRLHQEVGFDLVWHVTFANVWWGSLAALVGPPFVYGPVGGGAGAAWRTLPEYGLREAAVEGLRWLGVAAGRTVNPMARVAWQRARLILAQNPETAAWLPRRHRSKVEICPNPVLDERFDWGASVDVRDPGEVPTALFAGKLHSLKGPFLAVRAMVHLPGWRLVICGRGPEEARYRRLAHRLGVADRVEFRGHLPRDDLLRVMREEASVLLFPSLHDQAGWVVVEAAACGLPAVCVDRGGPPVLGAHPVPLTTLDETSRALAAKAVELAGTPGLRARTRRGAEAWTLEARVREVGEILDRVGLRGDRGPVATGAGEGGSSPDRGAG